MRLLNTRSKRLREFHGADLPEYAILSHTWEDEEVLYQDLYNGAYMVKKGWYKISNCCKTAARDGWEWVWIDTCCIDKRSSTELSEAINSMYRWYAGARVCYVYLSDLLPGASLKDDFNPAGPRWFSRGWTLQEFLAPTHVVFLNTRWRVIGTRTSLAAALEKYTRISIDEIKDFKEGSTPVATKMFWASRRRTSRIEDLAYCLMGVFGVNMPLLYGEGNRAFRRLQSEIVRTSTDQTIFAWDHAPSSEVDLTSGQMLAYSPATFKKIHRSREVRQHTFDMVKDGVSMTTSIWQRKLDAESPMDSNVSKQEYWLLPLNCHSDTSGQSLAIVLNKTGPKSYTRSAYPSICEIDDLALERDGWILYREQTIHLDDRPLSDEQSSNPYNPFRLSISACSCIRIRSAHSVSLKDLRTPGHLLVPQSTKPEFRKVPLRLFNNSFDRNIYKPDQLLIVLDYRSSPNIVPLSLLLVVDRRPSSGVSVMMSQYVSSDGGYGAFERASTRARAHSHDISVFRPGNESQLELVARVTPVPKRGPSAQDPFPGPGSRIDIFDRDTSGACPKGTTLEHLQKLTRRLSQRSVEQLLRLIYFQSSSTISPLAYAFFSIRFLLGDTIDMWLPHNGQLYIVEAGRYLLFCTGMYGPVLCILNILFNIFRDLYQYSSNDTTWIYWIWVAWLVGDMSATVVPIVVPSLTKSYNWLSERPSWAFYAWQSGLSGINLDKLLSG